MAFGFVCAPCAASDPATDTVKVSLPAVDAANDKENSAHLANLEAEAARDQAAAKLKAEEAEKARQAEARRQAIEAAARRAAEEQAAAAAAAAKELARREEDEAEAAEFAAAQQAALEAEAAELAREQELAARKASEQQQITEFLKKHGFKEDVNAKKSSLFKSKYPLHIAVKEQDPEMVKLLLSAGADKSLKNSSGYTAAQKAEQYCKSKKDDASREVALALGC